MKIAYVSTFDARLTNSWSGLGSNGSGNGAIRGIVNALWVAAGAVYVGGGFSDAAGEPAADAVARWDGSAWAALGSNGAGGGAMVGKTPASLTCYWLKRSVENAKL